MRIDTGEKDSSNNEMGAFKSVVNDMYARDISKKVRTAKRTRVEKGLFLGAFAPYGYTKDLNNKNRLVIDKEVSGVITGIFYEYLSGKTYTEIAKDLNNRNIDSPYKYKKRNTKFYCSSNTDLWSGNTVKKILTNQTYIGDLVQHKKEVINYKLKKTIDIPKSEYIIVENTHDAIIKKSDFYLVQELVKKKCHGSHSKDINQHLLSGLIYCPRCSGRYSYANKNNKTGEMVVICDTYRRYGKKYCNRIAIKERDINRYVLQNLKEVIVQKLDRRKLMDSVKLKEKDDKSKEIKEQIEKNKKRIDEISSIIKNIYEDKFNKIITEAEFNIITEEYRKEREIILNRISILEQDLKRYSNADEEDDKETIKLIGDVLDMKKVDKNILVRLIDRIEIIDKDNIKIKYKFSV